MSETKTGEGRRDGSRNLSEDKGVWDHLNSDLRLFKMYSLTIKESQEINIDISLS